MNDISIAVIPFHPLLGDNHGNAEKIISILETEKLSATDLVIFPELAISGYYARDLYYQKNFLAAQHEALEKIINASRVFSLPAFILGAAMQRADGLKNSLLFVDKGAIVGQRDKYNLPHYDIFDEQRYFTPADKNDKNFATPITWRGVDWGVMICEELWQGDVPPLMARHKPDVMVVINASPFEKNKIAKRLSLVGDTAKKYHTPIIYNNMCGGLDEVILDGHNIAADGKGGIVADQAFAVAPMRLIWRNKTLLNAANSIAPPSLGELRDTMAQYHAAIIIGLRDYMANNGFAKVIIGVSGGIDSALTLALAVDALGKDNVLAYFLPTGYSSVTSQEDAEILCANFGVALKTVDIEPLYQLFLSTLSIDEKNGGKVAIAAQNIQSRIRGVVLMARSNEHGAMLLATGNKSELAVGYSTLYGDSCGGYNLLKDLYKKDVYELAVWFNRNRTAQIPSRVIGKAPTAELSPGQKDSDSLPPYEKLDGDLEKIIEGFGTSTNADVEKMLRRNEFKRNQSAPGPKLTTRAFGNGWRLPLGHRLKT